MEKKIVKKKAAKMQVNSFIRLKSFNLLKF